MEERECVTHAKDVLTSFEGMKNDEKFCDFILKIGEEEIPVHRMVLAACSKYFDAMFSNDMKEAKTGRAEILGIVPSAGKQCLEFAYTGRIKFLRENPKDLIHGAELMQLHSLIDLYFEYLIENISVENCLEYMELALTYNQQSFANIFEKFLGENFAEIIKTEDFASMSQELLLQCLDSVRDETQNSEKLKWEAVTTWIKADLENREGVFPELFKKIKLENLPLEFVKETIANEPLVVESDKCKVHVFSGFRALRPRAVVSAPGRDLTHVVSYHKESRLLHKYNLITGKWSRFTRVPTIIGDHVDVVGIYGDGEIYAGTSLGLWKFCAETLSNWKRLSKWSYCQDYFRCAVSYPSVYVVLRDHVHIYNTRNDDWGVIQTRSDFGSGCAICASSDFLYAIEGCGDKRRAMELNLKADNRAWEPIASMNYGRINGAAVVFQGKVFALGGYHSGNNEHKRRKNTTIEYYEPTVDRWIVLPQSFGCNSYSGLDFKPFVFKDKLYVVENDKMAIKKLELSGFDNAAF